MSAKFRIASLAQLIAATMAATMVSSALAGDAAPKAHKHHTHHRAHKGSKHVVATPVHPSSHRKSHSHIHKASLEPSTGLREPALYSSSALVINAITGEHIYEKNIESVAPIASITKLMTAMVVLDMQLPLNERITITADDVDTLKNSSSRLLVGTTLTRGEVLHLALMASENRAAHALARTAPIGMDAFVARMNRMAQSLGMHHSKFADPTGLNSNNVSTAEDLTHMVEAAHQYPEIRQYSTSESMTFDSTVNGREYEFHNTNPLVKSDSWNIELSKTGYITEAGKCLVMEATIKETPVVIVLLDSYGKLTRIGDANRIKRWLESGTSKLKAG